MSATAAAAAVTDVLDSPLAAVAEVLERACGLSLSVGVRPALAEAVRRASGELGLARETFTSRLLGGDPAAVTALVEHAVVKETYFYRHPEQWAAVTRQLAALPPGQPLSVWSAGCATGEEAYTLAMVLHDAGRRGESDRVLGTDVSARALEVARAGRYREWSLRDLPAARRARHFTSKHDALCVHEERRAPVRFAQQNLLGALPAGGPFDLVACRNVLLYFKPSVARTVLVRLHAALRPGGLLLVGPIEEPLTAGLPFERLAGTEATLFRRPVAAREAGPGGTSP